MPVEIEILGTPLSQTEAFAPSAWRVLFQPALDGALNMALDEAILEAVAAGHSLPTLRFYGWQPPCLSLGMAQPASDVDGERLAKRGWGLVRRITGGRAILHTDEITYSLIVPASDPRVTGVVVESYRRLSAGLLAGLHALGASLATNSGPANVQGGAKGAVCFEVPSDYEITANGKKLLGSAQTRRRRVVLQHGALPLSGDIARICDALVFETEDARQAAMTRVRTRATTLSDVLGQPIAYDDAARAMAGGFSSALNLTLDAGDLSDAERTRAEELRATKYAAGSWTLRH